MGFSLKCYECNKKCDIHSHSIKVIDYKGEERYEEVCSEECFNKIIKRNSELHLKRYNEVLNQKYSKGVK